MSTSQLITSRQDRKKLSDDADDLSVQLPVFSSRLLIFSHLSHHLSLMSLCACVFVCARVLMQTLQNPPNKQEISPQS